MRYLIDSHPRIACPPESKFISGLLAFLGYPQALDGLDSLGLSAPATLTLVGDIVRHVFAQYVDREGKARWVDKTPNYYRCVEFIDAIFDGKVQYLYMVRHPLDNVLSLYESPYFTPAKATDPDICEVIRNVGHSPIGFATYWRHVYQALLAWQPSARVHWIRYEDVVRDAQTAADTVFTVLGEPIVQDIEAKAFGKTHTFGYQDWKIAGTTRVHAGSVGRAWTDAAQRDEVWRVVEDIAATFGYSRETSRVSGERAPARDVP